MEDIKQKIQSALAVAERFGGTDEDHHSAWVVDQMVRALTGDITTNGLPMLKAEKMVKILILGTQGLPHNETN